MSSQAIRQSAERLRPQRVFLIAGLPILVIGGMAIAYLFAKPATAGLNAVISVVSRAYPDVPGITATNLYEWLGNESREQPILLDVRTAEEFEVSHLDGAMRVEPEVEIAQLPPSITPDKPITLYCAVGYRASELANRMIEAGYAQIYNLSGGIYQWANLDLPMSNDSGEIADTVVPANPRSGRLLKPERRAILR